MMEGAVLADALRKIANAITPTVAGNRDATGGHVESLTEAAMGISAGLVQIANALTDVAEAIRESSGIIS